MNKMNPKVDFFFDKAGTWQKEVGKLRTVALDCGLGEELKWGVPCYTFEGANIVLIHVFKEYCALLFFKGALLNDPHGLLVQQTKSVQSARQIRFTGVKEISGHKAALQAYIYEAIEVEKAGLKVKFKKNPEPLPDELKAKFKELPTLKTAFESLTPGRQRGYILFFSAPKQSKTRSSRVEKHVKDILQGKGLADL